MVFCAVEHERVAFAKRDIRNFANAHCIYIYTLLLTLLYVIHHNLSLRSFMLGVFGLFICHMQVIKMKARM